MFLTSRVPAQSTGGKIANFGIDGDILSNFNVGASWDATGSHDWFKNANTTALGVIDTTGAAAAYTHLSAGENYAFDRGMSVPRYSVQDGYVFLDGHYARDYFGISGSGSNADLTSFTSGSKNGMAPSSFTTNPGGATVLDKCDIIDAYVHMRRNGSIVNGASSSHLIAMMAASTVSNNGNRFFDVEFYCSAITYNTSTGSFSNSGSALTGGHTAWAFNPDGSIKSFGDMDVAFSFPELLLPSFLFGFGFLLAISILLCLMDLILFREASTVPRKERVMAMQRFNPSPAVQCKFGAR